MAKGEVSKFAVTEIGGDQARKPTLQFTDDSAAWRHLPSGAFAGDGAELICIREREGRANFHVVGVSSFEHRQLTDSDGIFADGAWYCRRTRQLYYWHETALKSVNVDTLEETIHYGGGYQGGRLSVSPDGRLVAFGTETRDIPGLAQEFPGRWVLMLVSTTGEGSHPVLTAPFKVGRVEFSPTDPDCLTYTWAGRWDNVPQRLWWTDVSGLEGGPLGHQNPNEMRGGAFFCASGEYLGYNGSKYHIRRTDSGFFLEETAWLVGLVDSRGIDDRQFYLPGPTGRSRLSSKGDKFVCDVGGALVAEHRSISLVHLQEERGVFEPVFFLGAAAARQTHVPRPQFSPDDSQVVFTAATSGRSQVYVATLRR